MLIRNNRDALIKNHHRIVLLLVLTFLINICLMPIQPLSAKENLKWMDGQITTEPIPGKLLSDNPTYWGEVILTGVEYEYKYMPNKVPDMDLKDETKFGKRLIDGILSHRWDKEIGVAITNSPLIVLFDLKKEYKINEVDILTKSRNAYLEAEVAVNKNGPWAKCYCQKMDNHRDKDFNRLKFSKPCNGRYLRLTVETESYNHLSEVFIWGEGESQIRNLRGMPEEISNIKLTSLDIPILSVSPTLDGKIDDKAHLYNVEFRNFPSSRKNDDMTQAYFAYCPEGLYISFVCKEDFMSDRVYEEVSGNWDGDRIEIYIVPNTWHKARFYRFGVKSNGEVVTLHKEQIDATYSQTPPTISAKTKDYDKHWVAECIIPLSPIVGPNQIYQDWHLFLGRNRIHKENNSVQKVASSWPATDFFGNIERFAILKLNENNYKELNETGEKYFSFKGINRSMFSEKDVSEWKLTYRAEHKNIPQFICSEAPMAEYGPLPILPKLNKPIKTVDIKMTRDETECAAIFITNTNTDNEARTSINLPKVSDKNNKDVKNLDIQVSIAGCIYTRRDGVILRPLFQEDNMLGKELMDKYLTNGKEIYSFPDINFTPGGSCLIWLTVNSSMSEPGKYKAVLNLEGIEPLTINIEIIDIVLPKPDVWFDAWAHETRMYPFERSNRNKIEAKLIQDQGVTVWSTWPEKDTAAYYANQNKKINMRMIAVPSKYMHGGWNATLKPEDITAKDKEDISKYFADLQEKAKRLKVDLNQIGLQFWDEPGERNASLYGYIASFIKTLNPNAKIYCNPCFWGGAEGYTKDKKIHDLMISWYSLVDVSVPIQALTNSERFPTIKNDLFSMKRKFNCFYYIYPSKGRRLSWYAFKNNYNGWGYYSYFAPRDNPWNDMDGKEHDYQVVYPGPYGPVKTIEYELLREGWDDYRLLTLMKELGLENKINSIFNMKLSYAEKRNIMLDEIQNQF